MSYRAVFLNLSSRYLTAAPRAKKIKLKSPTWDDEYKGAGLLYWMISNTHDRKSGYLSLDSLELKLSTKNDSLETKYKPKWAIKLKKLNPSYPNWGSDEPQEQNWWDNLWARSVKRVSGMDFHPKQGVASSKHLMSVLDLGEDCKDWYENTVQHLKGIFGEHTDQFIDFLIHTSPRTGTKLNLEQATKAFISWKNGSSFKGDIPLVGNRYNVERSIRKMPGVGGLKVKNFKGSFYGDEKAVTIDTWLLEVLGIGADQKNTDTDDKSEKGVGTGDYQTLAEVVRHLTQDPRVKKKFGPNILPRQIMAMLWAGAKRKSPKHARDTEPYEVLLENYFKSNPRIKKRLLESLDKEAPNRDEHFEQTAIEHAEVQAKKRLAQEESQKQPK